MRFWAGGIKNPLFCEILPLTLEEIFISETEVAGYDIKNLIFKMVRSDMEAKDMVMALLFLGSLSYCLSAAC